MIVQECGYEPPHQHEWPDDWYFSGADGEDPRADSRWRPTTYEYLNERLQSVWLTQVPLCDDQAIDEFTNHADLGATYLQVRRPAQRTFELLPFQYERSTDTVTALG